MTHAILLLNLGTPDSPSEEDVKTYLAQFLMDPFVIDVPFLIRYFIVHFLILRTRPKQSAKAYSKIWTSEGSPLMIHSVNSLKKLQERSNTPTALAMRYGNPSITSVLTTLLAEHPELDELTVLPLYPQYALSSTKTAIVEFENALKELKASHINVHIIQSFYNHPLFIKAYTTLLAPLIEQHKPDHILFSYHGLPVRHLIKADPSRKHCGTPNCCSTPAPAHETCYKHQCLTTTELIIKALQKEHNAHIPDYTVSFQSRLGKDEWIQPFTTDTLEKLGKSGVKTCLVCCPSFVADCLETLEEMGVEGQETFLEAGGTSFILAPCLNDQEAWIDAMQNIVETKTDK